MNQTVACGLTTCISLPDTTLMADLVSSPSPRIRSLHHICFGVKCFTQNQSLFHICFGVKSFAQNQSLFHVCLGCYLICPK